MGKYRRLILLKAPSFVFEIDLNTSPILIEKEPKTKIYTN